MDYKKKIDVLTGLILTAIVLWFALFVKGTADIVFELEDKLLLLRINVLFSVIIFALLFMKILVNLVLDFNSLLKERYERKMGEEKL